MLHKVHGVRVLRRAMIARKRVQIFKPAIDTRYGFDEANFNGLNAGGCGRLAVRQRQAGDYRRPEHGLSGTAVRSRAAIQPSTPKSFAAPKT